MVFYTVKLQIGQ